MDRLASSITEDRGNLKPEDLHKAQLNVVSIARQAGLSNVDSKGLLATLGIAERVVLGDEG